MSDKEFIRKFEKDVKETIRKYDLLEKKDRILVAVSGGKDSMSVLYILRKLGYDVSAATVDSGIPIYNKENIRNIRKMTEELEVKLFVFSFEEEAGSALPKMISKLRKKGIPFTSCNVCGVFKRHILNRKARELGFTKIVTGHNLDDEAQSFLMNLFRGNLEMAARQSPVSGLVRDSRFVPRVKPLYMSREHDVERYAKLMDFPIGHRVCPLSDSSYRYSLKHLVWDYEKKENKDASRNIIRHFLKIRPKLVGDHFVSGQSPKICEICGEPSKASVCNACKIIGTITS